jgi:hypothetical protein
MINIKLDKNKFILIENHKGKYQNQEILTFSNSLTVYIQN